MHSSRCAMMLLGSQLVLSMKNPQGVTLKDGSVMSPQSLRSVRRRLPKICPNFLKNMTQYFHKNRVKCVKTEDVEQRVRETLTEGIQIRKIGGIILHRKTFQPFARTRKIMVDVSSATVYVEDTDLLCSPDRPYNTFILRELSYDIDYDRGTPWLIAILRHDGMMTRQMRLAKINKNGEMERNKNAFKILEKLREMDKPDFSTQISRVCDKLLDGEFKPGAQVKICKSHSYALAGSTGKLITKSDPAAWLVQLEKRDDEIKVLEKDMEVLCTVVLKRKWEKDDDNKDMRYDSIRIKPVAEIVD